MNERKQRVEALFAEALALDTPRERADCLDRATRDDPAIRREVEELLRAAGEAGRFLAMTAGADEAAAPASPELDACGVGEATGTPGQTVGRYKLLEKIGEGGCGVVFMAEQSEPVRRKVALKIIKPGMDSRQVVARFEAERQALALMDHPNIAKFLDAGVTDNEGSAGFQPAVSPTCSRQGLGRSDGVEDLPCAGQTDDPQVGKPAIQQTASLRYGATRPYFVMELVRGIRITDYCARHNLSTRERLDLFIAVCRAVQHAHQKGIIHRDLKPSNILVTVNDGVPVPKIIDFGIAKATQQELTEKTLFTAFGQFMGTPAYMSPEQAAMTSLDIDTRSDIYSLGVLLYELLTGTTPFETRQLLKAGFDEMRRIIRETEPERPSTRLTQSRSRSLGATSGDSAVRTSCSALDRDLDWIVMKCLEKDPNRRYATANGLAADLQRHLNYEPVVARPPSTAYRLRRMVRRNRLAFAAGVVVVVVMVGGTLVSAWQAMRATRAERQQMELRQHAERESALRRQAARFLAEVFSSNFKRVEPGTDTGMMREILDHAVAQLDLRTPNDEHIRYTLALAYWAIRDDLRAEQLMRDALEIARRGLAGNNPNVQSRVLDIVWFLNDFRRHAEREALLTEVLTSATPIRDEGVRLQLLASRGFVRAMQGKWPEAAEDFATGVELEPDNPDWHHHLAPLLVRIGKQEDYARHRQASLQRFANTADPVVAERIAKDALILPLHGSDLEKAGRLAELAASVDESHWAWIWFQHVNALAELRQGHYATAIERGQRVLAHEGAVSERDVQACMIVAMAYAGLRQAAEARAWLLRGREIAEARLEKIESRDVGDDWIDWIYAHALMDEAKRIVEGPHGSDSLEHPNRLATPEAPP